jgi:hypothetical protein
MSSIEQPHSTLCPHYENVDEKLLSKLSTKVAKVRSENKELFEFTHRRITVFDALADGKVTYAEEDIYKKFTEHHEGNFVTVIEGNVGTGKSELCAYLSHQLRDDGRPVLHINKNADLLSILAEEIPQFHQEHIGGELPGASNVKQLQQHVRSNRETVARLVVSKAILNVTDLENTSVNIDGIPQDELEKFVQKKLTAISERGELAEKVRFVDPGEVTNFEYLNVFENKSTAGAAEAWNDAIWEAIRDEYDSPSMDQLLKRVGQEFDDNRPVFVFEDFSISTLDAEKLRNYMEDDNPENNWDFIVAGTQDSTEILRTQTGVERHEFYRTNRPDSSQVLFLDETSCIEFIRPYLGYIKHLDGSVAYERDENNEILSIIPPADGSRCQRCGFCDDSFRDLFPLTETFLQRVYSGLDEDDQRPRQYVQKVFNILEDYFENIVESPANSGELDNLANPVTVSDSVYENEDIRRLTKWYGNERKNSQLQVDARLPLAFGLGDADVTELGIEKETAKMQGNTATASQGVWVVPTSDRNVGGSGGGGTGRGVSGGSTTISQEQKKIKELKSHLDTWRNNPGTEAAADVDVYMRKGLSDAFIELTEDFSIESYGSLEYAIGGNEYSFVFEGQDVPDRVQIEIDPEDFNPSDLLELLTYGVYREMSPRSADKAALFKEIGTQLTAHVREWRNTIRTTYLENSENFFVVGASTNSFENFVLGIYGMAVLLDNPWKRLDAERIVEAYFDEELSIDEELKSALKDRLKNDQIKEIKSFMHQTDNMETLMGDYYAASGNVLDLPEIRDNLSQAPPLKVVDSLKKGGLKNLPAKLQFGSKESLRDLGLAAYDVGSALAEVNGSKDAHRAVSFVNHQLHGINMGDTSDYITKIRTYDDVSPDVKESLGLFSDYSSNEINEILRACSLYTDLKKQKGYHDGLHAALAGLKLYEDELTVILAEIDLSGVHSSNDTSKFLKLSEKYASQ